MIIKSKRGFSAMEQVLVYYCCCGVCVFDDKHCEFKHQQYMGQHCINIAQMFQTLTQHLIKITTQLPIDGVLNYIVFIFYSMLFKEQIWNYTT